MIRHKAFLLSGRWQYLAPHKFAPIMDTAGLGPWTATYHVFFRWKIILVQCCKTTAQHLRHLWWLDVFLLFCRRKSPTAGESRCPGPKHGPSGAATTQVGAGLHMGAAGGCFSTDSFRAVVLCPKVRLHWRVFFMLKWDVDCHPLCVCWTTATTTTSA